VRKLIDQLAIAATIDPQAIDGTTASSDYIALKNGEQALFILSVGATDAVIDMALWEATSSGGAGAQALTGFAITQIAADGDLGQAAINVRAEDLSATFTHVKALVTVASTGSGGLVSVVGLLGNLRYSPASAFDLASVAELVS
jgi:hypothetical protein